MADFNLGQGFKTVALRIGESRLTGWLVALAFFALFARFGQVIFESHQEPFTFYSVEVVTPKIKLGEPVQLVYRFRRDRICPTTIAEFYLEEGSGNVVYRAMVPGGYAPLGERVTAVNLRLPFVPAPGRYIYRSVMNSDCGLSAYSQLVPDAHFQVALP